MWGRVMQQNADHEARYQYIEARRREMDTESNWSTNAAVGGPGVNQGGVLPSRYVPRNWEYRNWEYVFNSPDETWNEARERDRWAGLDYRAAHFTWTHKCYGRTKLQLVLCVSGRDLILRKVLLAMDQKVPYLQQLVAYSQPVVLHLTVRQVVFLLHTLQGIHIRSDSLRARVRRCSSFEDRS